MTLAYSWDLFWQDVGVMGFIVAFSVLMACAVAGICENARQEAEMRDDLATVLRRAARRDDADAPTRGQKKGTPNA